MTTPCTQLSLFDTRLLEESDYQDCTSILERFAVFRGRNRQADHALRNMPLETRQRTAGPAHVV